MKSTNDLSATWLTINGIRIYSRSGGPVGAGSVPAVVLVHGIGVSGTYMIPAARELARRSVRVYVPDLPGFGHSDKPRNISTVWDLADDLAAYMDEVGLKQTALVGNSYGCQIIAEFCLRHPARASRIVLLGPTIDRAARTVFRQFCRLMLDSIREPPSQIAIVAFDYLRFGLFRYLRTFMHALNDRIEDKAPHITVPALVIRGSRDPIAPQEWVDYLVNLFPRGELAIVEGGPHTSNYACPKEFVRVILPFLTSVNAGRNPAPLHEAE